MEAPRMEAGWVVQNFNLDDANVIAIYLYGSRVYGTETERSDWDYIVVLHNGPNPEETIQGVAADADATIMHVDRYQQLLNQHSMNMLECLFLPRDKILLERQDFRKTWMLDAAQLRRSVSARVGHSWSKAQKKLEVAHEIYIGKKSLFHSFRIMAFGIQIARHGSIMDYSAMNHIWTEINENPSDQWSDYRDKYKKQWNKLKSELRASVPGQLLNRHSVDK
eukprot:TRINITY_DN12247_c0_g1_i1.p1 TRINITY_DN12247_c0_g1~~TRINITY_DN12247_c0_g1_i1.p1  ORF type:complete len:222 (-),score=22.37 TRINITY_DN12247_c0_g1_i1:67-732(-)